MSKTTEGLIKLNGSELFYTEKNKHAGQTIFFFHGNSSSHRTWESQIESELLTQYRLIAFDLPAHGYSGTIKKGYDLPGIGALMAEAILQLSMGKPYLMSGVSLGTNIIIETNANEKIHPKGILLAGPCITGEEFTFDKMAIPGTKVGLGFIDKSQEEELLLLRKEAFGNNAPGLTEIFLSDFLNVKDNFRSSIGASIGAGNYNDHIRLLQEKNIPVLIIFGEKDQLINPSYLDNATLPLHGGKIIKFEGAGHWLHLDAPTLFNQVLQAFAKDVFNNSCS